MGRPRTPTETLRARDSRYAKGREETEPRYEPGSTKCPPFLKGEAKKEWQRVIKLLSAQRVYADVDRAVLIAYVEAWEEYRWCSDQIAEKGFAIKQSGHTVPNPLIKVRARACERLLQLASHFGMTAATRSRVKAMSGVEDERSRKLSHYFNRDDEDEGA